MVDKVPGAITAGVAKRGSRVHATEATINLSRSHLEENISRLQSATQVHDAALDYLLGDLVNFLGAVYFSTAIIPAEPFDPAKWNAVSNWIQALGILSPANTTNKVKLFNTFDQVPPPTLLITGSHQDATNMGAPIPIYISGDFAYVGASNVGAAKGAVEIIDIHKKTAPVRIGGIANTILLGINDLFVAGRYAYAVMINSSAFVIIDLLVPSAPVIKGIIQDFINLGQLRAIHVSGKYAYVISNTLNRLIVIDISDPANPFIASFLTDNINFLGAVGIYAYGSYVYITGVTTSTFSIVDISNPLAPVRKSTITDVPNLAAPFDIFVTSKNAYVLSNAANKLNIIDISNPLAPTITTSFQDNTNLLGSMGLFVAGRYAYVTARNATQVTIIDIEDPNTPVFASKVKDATKLNGVTGIFVDGKYVYATSTLDNSLQIIDVGGANLPTLSSGTGEFGSLSVHDSGVIEGNLSVMGGMNVGQQGIKSDGDVSLAEKTIVTRTKKVGIKILVPLSDFDLFGSLGLKIKNSAVDVDSGDETTIRITDTTIPRLVRMLTANTVLGRTYFIKNATDTNNITVTTEGSQTIDGATTLSIVPRGSAIIQCDGTNWDVIAKT